MVRSMKVFRIIVLPVSLLALLLGHFFFGETQLKDGLLHLLRNFNQQSINGHHQAAYTGSLMGWLGSQPSDSSSLFKQHSQSSLAVSPPPIKLSASDRPPQLGGRIRSGHLIAKAYRNALKDIELTVFTLVNRDPIFSTAEFKAGTLGVPGTGIRINDERRALQAWLDCTSGEGEWRWQPTNDGPEPRTMTVHKQGPLEAKCERAFYEGHQLAANRSRSPDDWDVRASLKFQWYPSSRCEALRPGKLHSSPRLTRRALCRSLSKKSTLIVGDVSQYALHDLLLDWTTTKQASCAGNLYCKIHPICSDELDPRWIGNSSQLEAGELDAHVYFKIPPQPFNQSYFVSNVTPIDHPSLAPLRSSIRYPNGSRTFLRYRRSDSLWGSSSPSHARFQPIWLHPNNGIRDINNFWYGDVRKSDLIILSRRPLGLPRRSQMSQAFIHNKHLPLSHLEYLRKHSRSQVWRADVRLAAEEGSDGVTAAVSLIRMAIKMVMEVWLPEVLLTLKQLQRSHGRASKLIVWRGEWRIHGDCTSTSLPQKANDGFDWDRWWKDQPSRPGDGNRPHPSPPDLFSILFPNHHPPTTTTSSSSSNDPQTTQEKSKIEDLKLKNPRLVFHNLQTIFQNQLMRKLGPEFGIPFLDLESQASVWRTGLVASPSMASRPHSVAHSDCFDYCFPSPGLTLEESFLGGLLKILSVSGWTNSTGNR
ncbi:hypothetical protein PGT21_019021 [Puccinia graminis f. sp. tritici]|uniref:Uncharacterized protein n=1 Tax=Puccinia graminis f. sp. tritici TaxID=56615 RepID=A0A5B0QIL4_PUCGR|nr:hypothetical protein PGT21_019021 [Puccinia graminis f. sp. tritici]